MQTIFVIFWSTGDLAKRKLFPALFNIYKNPTQQIDIIWVWRKDFDREGFVEYIKKETSEFIAEDSKLDDFFKTVSYSRLEINQKEDYLNLKQDIEKIQTKDCQIVFYLSIASEHFPIFIDNYKYIWIDNIKVIFEKPFGKDLESAESLNSKIMEVFTEDQVYRIDHYVAKEAVQNIIAFRFANIMFDPIRNNQYIDNIQITASEDIGVLDRWWYYDKSWALRDMMQNHLLQMLSFITMEPPIQIDASWIWKEKLKVINNLELGKDFLDNVVFGQYVWYKDEKWIMPNSRTETFVAAKIQVDTPRFSWVPIYLRTGKCMRSRLTHIVIEFKNIPNILFQKYWNIERNRIILEVQPKEGINIHFNIKENGSSKEVQRVRSSFVKDIIWKDAYEKLIEDVILWDKTLFTSWDLLKQSWKVVDDIVNCKNNCPILFQYEKWTNGPIESYNLLEKDWRKWYE